MKRRFCLLAALLVFLGMAAASPAAADGARRGLSVCALSLAPSLFPFFVLSKLLSSLGLAELLSGLAGRRVERLFRVSACGMQAFFLGITGGYPLGASAAAQLRREGRVSRAEAEHLLAFCNNSGPAFIVGAAGGVFRSPKAGLLLYACHVLAALCVGFLMRPKHAPAPVSAAKGLSPASFAMALPEALSAGLSGTLSVCGYVTFFSALLGLVPGVTALDPLPRAMVSGLLELGSGVAALAGLPPDPLTLATAAFLLGWGSLSVHCQTLGAVADSDISCARHLAGRALCGSFAAVFTYVSSSLLF